MLDRELTLLYVEDNQDAQELISMLFKDEIAHLYQAYNGEDGLTLYKDKRPDIVVSDINMPILNGLDMIEAIKKIDKEQSVILLSAFDDKEILLRAIALGVDYFLQKPIDVEIFFEQLNEVAQKKKEKDHLQQLALYDSLTQILNRYTFDMELKNIFSSAKRHNNRFALIFLDLDDFKEINDNYSHSAGDFVLKETTKRIKNILRQEDIFARLGGDELAIIIENFEDSSEIEKIADKILESVRQPIEYSSCTLKVGCSIGISLYPDDGDKVDTLIDRADNAMYSIKHKGKSGYSFYSHIRTAQN